MANEDMSPERTRAYYRLREAEQQIAKGHLEEAVGIARDALETDPTYIEARHWIAQQYEKANLPRKAAVEYQDILHADRDDQVAWTRIRALDPQAADRLDRLHNIAPDPFVMDRKTDLADSLDDIEGLGGEATTSPEEPYFALHDAAAGVTDALEELAGTDAIQAQVGDEAVPASEVAADDMGADEAAPTLLAADSSGPPEWLYEEDLPYRDRVAHDKFVAGLVTPVIEFWAYTDTWDTSISGLAHLDKKRHGETYATFAHASATLGAPEWSLFFSPERRMTPVIMRGDPAVVAVTTGLMNILKPAEMAFVAGRLTAHLRAGHVPYLQIAGVVLDRRPRSITDVETDMQELLRSTHTGIRGLHRDERFKLSNLCHAWQMRAELSADRGGLICCRDLDAACNAIAKGTALDSRAAEMLTWQQLRDKFKGQDINALIAIPSKEDPVRNEGYGFYRIRMLRWWAGTDQGKQLLGLA